MLSIALMELLKHMGFGQKFTNALHAIYDKPKAQMQINNATSSSFNLHRGTCQGDPLSPKNPWLKSCGTVKKLQGFRLEIRIIK